MTYPPANGPLGAIGDCVESLHDRHIEVVAETERTAAVYV